MQIPDGYWSDISTKYRLQFVTSHQAATTPQSCPFCPIVQCVAQLHKWESEIQVLMGTCHCLTRDTQHCPSSSSWDWPHTVITRRLEHHGTLSQWEFSGTRYAASHVIPGWFFWGSETGRPLCPHSHTWPGTGNPLSVAAFLTELDTSTRSQQATEHPLFSLPSPREGLCLPISEVPPRFWQQREAPQPLTHMAWGPLALSSCKIHQSVYSAVCERQVAGSGQWMKPKLCSLLMTRETF